ncbi:MAG TPA: DUF192 domain-containing protein [Flavobacteriaceae bacterium]|nr:DUF192 domain-containing protein [Flavobacteriaceae bacterium]
MKSRKLLIKTIALSTVSFGLLYTVSCKEKENSLPKPVEISFTKEGELMLYKKNTDSVVQTLAIEIATNDYEHQTGLMYRQSMDTFQGMLFIFKDSKPRYFYMKNTYIPLDIIYLDKEKTIVSIQENAKPMSETTLPSNANAMYVLEINAGLVEKWNLEVGDYIQYHAF